MPRKGILGCLHRGHGQGPCTGAMGRGHAQGPCTGAMHRGHGQGPCTGAMHRGHAQGHAQGPCAWERGKDRYRQGPGWVQAGGRPAMSVRFPPSVLEWHQSPGFGSLYHKWYVCIKHAIQSMGIVAVGLRSWSPFARVLLRFLHLDIRFLITSLFPPFSLARNVTVAKATPAYQVTDLDCVC